MRTSSGFIKAGICLVISVSGLASILLYAAYERAFGHPVITPLDMLQNSLIAAAVGIFLLLMANHCLRNDSRYLKWLSCGPSSMLMIAMAGALGMLLLFHLNMTGDNRPLFFDGGTAVLIAALFAIEMAILILSRLRKNSAASVEAVTPDYRVMRPAIFLFLFGIDLSMSFIPLHMENLAVPLFGLSPDLMMGLPISTEFFCVGIAILLCGVWLDRRGWKEPFYYGLLLAGAGSLYSWFATDALNFIISRGVLGFGYGLSLLAAQGFVIRHTDSTNKARGLAHLFAGLYSGSICGAATGAVMAERFGYDWVFLIGASIIFAVVIYGLVYIQREEGKQSTTSLAVSVAQAAKAPQTVTSDVMAFMLNRRVLAAVLFSSMPASIAVVGFLNYFSPVYLNREGVNESTIGQVLMLFGVCLALLGPAVGRLADACSDKRIPIVVGGLLGGCAFLSFTVFQGVAAVAVAVLLLGLSNCFVLSAQSAFVLQQDVTGKLGEGKAMGIFRSSSRIGQMLGPVVFAALIIMEDIENAVTFLGVGYLFAVVLFLLLAGRESTEVVDVVDERTI